MQTVTSRPLQRNGYTTIAVVVMVAIISLSFLGALFKQSIVSQETITESTLRIDASQREEAFLDAMLSLVPERAIQTMQADSLNNSDLEWRSIIIESLERANAYGALDQGTLDQLNISGRSANPSNIYTENIYADWKKYVLPVDADLPNAEIHVSPGVNRSLGDNFPPALSYPYNFTDDATYPIISKSKLWDSSSNGYVILPTSDYPIHNLLPYPDLMFSLTESGESIVGKRNWWAFQLNLSGDYSSEDQFETYLFSIYELPMQLPINSASYTTVGTHQNGADWTSVDISGTIYAKQLLMTGVQAFDKVASQQSNDVYDFQGTIDGVALAESQNFHDLFMAQGSREAYQISTGSSAPISSGQDSGRVALVSLNRGIAFYDLLATQTYNDVLSETNWDEYSHGASQCAMRVTVTRTVSESNQTPQVIDFSFYSGGVRVTRTYEIGVNWPDASSTEGLEFPFHPLSTDIGRNTLAVYLERIQPFLDDLGADNSTINHSLAVQMDYLTGTNVIQPSFPFLNSDMGVVLLEGEDLTAYTRGFSLVTHCTLFIADDLNLLSTTPPAGSTVPTPFFPPLSLYAPESRFGISVAPREVAVDGQLGNLSEITESAASILDLKSGIADEVVASNITANLYQISHPDQLPPIYTMNWLVTLERIQSSE